MLKNRNWYNYCIRMCSQEVSQELCKDNRTIKKAVKDISNLRNRWKGFKNMLLLNSIVILYNKFACSRRPLLGGGRWKSQNRKIVPLSPYVEKPLNSKVIKSFVPELRNHYISWLWYDIWWFYYPFIENQIW